MTDDLEWWADDIWQLKSRWSPVGAVAFVTVLVDPQWHGNRRKGEASGRSAAVLSGLATEQKPPAAIHCSLKASKEEIEEFVEVLASFRKLHGNV